METCFLTSMKSYVAIAPTEQLPKVLQEEPDLKEWRDRIYKIYF